MKEKTVMKKKKKKNKSTYRRQTRIKNKYIILYTYITERNLVGGGNNIILASCTHTYAVASTYIYLMCATEKIFK